MTDPDDGPATPAPEVAQPRRSTRDTIVLVAIVVAVVVTLVMGAAYLLSDREGDSEISSSDTNEVDGGAEEPDPAPGTEPSTTPQTTTPPTTEEETTPGDGPLPALAAITADGDAVLLVDAVSEPVLLYDEAELAEVTEGPGPNVVDHVSAVPGLDVAFVGTCCEPIAGQVLRTTPPELAGYDPPLLHGYNPAVAPGGEYVAIGNIHGYYLTVYASDDLVAFPNVDGPTDEAGTFSPFDMMWLDDRTPIVLGLAHTEAGTQWVVSSYQFDGTDVRHLATTDLAVPPFEDDFERTYDFAGRLSADRIAVHEGGSDTILGFHHLDATTTEEHALPEPALSVWSEPDQPLVYVDLDGTLQRGDATVPGAYTWARPASPTGTE